MRICNECGKHVKESGYVVENGVEYYCSNDCLHKHYTPSEWEKMYDNGSGDSYWTTWDREQYNICITETLQRTIPIMAYDEDEAISMVEEQYDKGIVELDYNDLVDVKIDNIENM